MDERSIDVAAPAEVVWDLVSDVTRSGEWSPESTGGRWLGRASGPAPGARFVGFNRHGIVWWVTRCRVEECTRPGVFSFRVVESRMRWGWRIESTGPSSSRVTQWRERYARPNVLVRALAGSGLLGRDREKIMVDDMGDTLAAVKARAERAA
ncbi:MAG: polyketide cyclase [Pseudonocardia sp. SCN 72-86]|nr:MAG: polyketide cyclase [Pseudonocardia sp. SCN 72-86]